MDIYDIGAIFRNLTETLVLLTWMLYIRKVPSDTWTPSTSEENLPHSPTAFLFLEHLNYNHRPPIPTLDL